MLFTFLLSRLRVTSGSALTRHRASLSRTLGSRGTATGGAGADAVCCVSVTTLLKTQRLCERGEPHGEA